MLLVGVLCSLLPFVSANTEIRNFAATLSSVNLQLDVNTVLLPRTTTAHTLVRAPPGTQPCLPLAEGCTHELWAVLDLDAEHHVKYSLRLSWPGSMPTDFSMDIFDPADAAVLLRDAGAQEIQAQTRQKYVRIRAIDAGVRTPTSASLFSYLYPFAPYASNTSAISDSDSGTQGEEEEVHFFLTLDPLLLTLLPASLLPFLGVAATVLTLVAVFVLPRVQAGVAALVADVHAEMEKEKERLKRE